MEGFPLRRHPLDAETFGHMRTVDSSRSPIPLVNLLMRLAAFPAALPVYWLRAAMSHKPVDIRITLVLFLSPYALIAFSPPKWRSLQAGLAVGYASGMQALLLSCAIVCQLVSEAEPIPMPRERLYLSWNWLLLVLAIANWTWDRKQINGLRAAGVTFLALFYPLIAFVLHLYVLGPLLR